jgi:hypothetical protein
MAFIPYISEYNPPDGFLKDKVVLARSRAEAG